MLFEPLTELVADDVFHHRSHFAGDQLVFRLRGEFRVRHFHGDDHGEAFARVVATQVHLLLLGDAGCRGIVVDATRQRGAIADQVGAAVALTDVIGKGERVLVVGIVPLHRHFDADAVFLAAHQDGGVQGHLAAVEVFHVSLGAAFVEEFGFLRLLPALVGEDNAHARVQEGQLADAVLQRAVIEHNMREGFARREEGDLRALLAFGFAGNFQRCGGNAMLEAHAVLFPVAPDNEFQPFGKRVHDRDADAVQTARDFIGILVELAAGMQLGHDHFGSAATFCLVHVDRNTAAVIFHRYRAVLVDGDIDAVAMAGERFVDRVVEHFIDHVMETRAVIRVADIHAGAFAHGLQALQDLDGIGAVFAGVGRATGDVMVFAGGFVFHCLIRAHFVTVFSA